MAGLVEMPEMTPCFCLPFEAGQIKNFVGLGTKGEISLMLSIM